jgi:rhodanese-related sulfurtransferase
MSMTPSQLVAEAMAQIQQIDIPATSTHLIAGGAVIDVREPGEYLAGHLPGSVNIPRGVLEFKIGDNATLANKDLPIVLYCKTGGRAALAAVNLQRMGYQQVRSLSGGFDGWVSGGQQVVTDPETTLFG